MNQFLEYALKYAELGWQVFPIVPCQKVPLTAHGVKDATSDADQIRAWWTKWPNANIAMACGKPSGVYVIDVDVEQATNINGFESLKEFPELPHTISQGTPRGGCHAFYRTGNPPTNRNSFRPGIDIRGDGYYVVIAPSIHPNGGVYEWMFPPWDSEPAEFPEFMRPTTKAPWAGDSSPKQQSMGAVAAAKPDTLQRASLYLAECEAAIQGCAGHDKLLWAAVAMVHGFLLPDEQVLLLLEREYNPRCVPPWDLSLPKDAKDFRRKVSEARKLVPTEAPGWLLNDSAYALVDPAQIISKRDVAKLIENSKSIIDGEIAIGQVGRGNRREKIVVSCGAELEFLICPPGLLGQICSWINETAHLQQPLLTLGCVLAFLGMLFGRKVRGPTGVYTNIYCMGVAPSSSGKDHAPEQIRRLCGAAGCAENIGAGDVTSSAAIECRLEKHPATLYLWDEIGYMFRDIRSGQNKHRTGIISTLMQLFSRAATIYSPREYASSSSEQQKIIVRPSCNIYGTSSPERFCEGISPEELQDGWLSRCLIFQSGFDGNLLPVFNDVIPVPPNIVGQVQAWASRQIATTDGQNIAVFADQQMSGEYNAAAPEQIVIPEDTEARNLFLAFFRECAAFGKATPQLDCLWRKGQENARKIAVIVAAGSNFDAPRITVSIADYAIRLIRYLLLSFGEKIVPAITSSQIEAQKHKLLKIINQAGVNGCPNRNLVQRARWSTKKQRDSLLADLIEAEEIIAQIKDGKRVPSFWTVENYREYLGQQGNLK